MSPRAGRLLTTCLLGAATCGLALVPAVTFPFAVVTALSAAWIADPPAWSERRQVGVLVSLAVVAAGITWAWTLAWRS